MSVASAFMLMSAQQQNIEATWYEILLKLAGAPGQLSEIILSTEHKTKLGCDGIASIAQRCSAFNNAQVEVRDDTMTGTVRITVISHGSTNNESISEASPNVDVGHKKAAKVSRPPNAFILYRQHLHPTIVAQNPGLHNNEISKIIGKMWHAEPDSVKSEWKNKSENAKRQHLKDHPDYQYQPRKSIEKKRRMTKRKAAAIVAAQAEPSTPQSAAQSPDDFRTAQQPVGLVDMPSLNYTTNGQMATFTFDPSQQSQMDLFSQMVENHNTLAMAAAAPISAPATLPTALHNSHYQLVTLPNDTTPAATELLDFEATLEEALSRELEEMEEQRINGTAQTYNDLEAERFTEFLEQMPEHMWGMEFVL